jgi:hypothetical protein
MLIPRILGAAGVVAYLPPKSSPEKGPEFSPGFQPISANNCYRPGLIVPEGRMRVAQLRKAYVATEEDGCASPWLSGAP